MAVATRRRPHSTSLLPLAKEKLRHLASGLLGATPKSSQPKIGPAQHLDKGAETQLTHTLDISDKNVVSPDDMLLNTIVAILRNVYPRELSAKEIYTELEAAGEKEVLENCKSAVILSTKLNSYWRRYHLFSSDADRATILNQLGKCPISRSNTVSSDNRKRLAFKWLSEDDRQIRCDKEIEARDGTTTVLKVEQPAGSVTPPYYHNEEPDTDTLETTGDNDAPAHTVKTHSPPPSPPYQLRKTIKRTPNAFVGAVSRQKSGTPESSGVPAINPSKVKKSSKYKQTVPPGANPYYDSESFASLFSSVDAHLALNDDPNDDLSNLMTEDVQIDDLDLMFM